VKGAWAGVPVFRNAVHNERAQLLCRAKIVGCVVVGLDVEPEGFEFFGACPCFHVGQGERVTIVGNKRQDRQTPRYCTALFGFSDRYFLAWRYATVTSAENEL
jgi:hypothetical protein